MHKVIQHIYIILYIHHVLFNCFLIKVSNKIFLKEESASEKRTSFAEMTRTENSNAKKGPTKNFNTFKEFHDSETVANILAAWMHFTGLDSIEGNISSVEHHSFMVHACMYPIPLPM